MSEVQKLSTIFLCFPPKAPNEAENSLIDLGPGTSSAVRQPEVTNNLSSQLAGMSMLPCSFPLSPSPMLLWESFHALELPSRII